MRRAVGKKFPVRRLFLTVSLLASTENGLGRLSCVCIRIVGSGMFLLPLPTVCVTFGEDVAVGRGSG